MIEIDSFEDLKAWKYSRQLTKDIHDLTSQHGFNRELRNKMIRNASSIMDAIAAGFDRENINEFIQLLNSSRHTCSTLKSQLYRAVDVAYIDKTSFELYSQKIANVSKLLDDLIDHLKISQFQNKKHKKYI